MEILTIISEFIDKMIDILGNGGPLLGSFLILIESIIPVLPVSVFITLLFLSFGNIIGFIVSWICTVIGCMISFFLCRKFFQKFFTKWINKKEKGVKLMKKIDMMKFHHIVILVAIPFTPAFLVNIVAGLSQMETKKFFFAMLLGKIFMVYFWGFVGTSLIQSFTNPSALLRVAIMCLVAYIAGRIINMKFDLDGGKK